jgi:hypothetical protein
VNSLRVERRRVVERTLSGRSRPAITPPPGRIGVSARRVLLPVRRGGVTGVSKTALGALAVSPPSRSDPRREALL